ncbi:VPLPA-CTERM sorting domain-containing protein [Marinobacterium mangrovicola]|uniref:Putative secreted protein n=1 Tax=Marinobacterium mangrovicola TaxID=1476959 RepID=A0A4R1GJZ7_9GAMM|nr:VPLPA-CTERM sorting domain-containing protein [Marinobacterium mangrovicola]TCK07530.1 putative secreted protein [Marinobacterium mangrovicola]
MNATKILMACLAMLSAVAVMPAHSATLEYGSPLSFNFQGDDPLGDYEEVTWDFDVADSNLQTIDFTGWVNPTERYDSATGEFVSVVVNWVLEFSADSGLSWSVIDSLTSTDLVNEASVLASLGTYRVTVFGEFDQAHLRVSAVPIPAAALLFGTALIGFAGFQARRKVS